MDKYEYIGAIHYVPTGNGCGYYKVTLPNGSILTGDSHAEVMHDLDEYFQTHEENA